MPSVKIGSKVIFICFLVTLTLHTRASAFDRKTSATLSHYIIAAMHEQLGDIDTAIREYRKALRTDNKSSVIHINLASLYIKKNDIPKAAEELKITIGLDPEAVEPHAILALLYFSQDKKELASREYEIALQNASRLEPKNVDIYKTLGLIYLQQKKFKEAQGTYQLILDLSPDDAEARFYLANIYEELKDRPRAVIELKKSLEINPDYEEALNYLGYIYVEEGANLAEAERMIKKALARQPENGAFVDSLGWLYFKQGKIQEAVKELERAVFLMEDPVIYDHMGDAYLKSGNLGGARTNWEKSLQLDPNQDKIKEKINKLTSDPATD